MKPSKSLQSFLHAAGSSLLAVSSASAQSGTWLGNGDAWNTTTAWSGGTIADGSANTANFTGVNLTSDVSMSLGANRTINRINFTDAVTSSNDLTLTGNTLTLAGTTPTLNVTQPDRNLTISSILAGTAGFTKSGQGTLILTGSNSITGNTVLSAGTLVLDYTPNDNRKLPTGSFSSSGGTIVLKGGSATENSTSFIASTGAGTFFVRDTGTAKINLNGFTLTSNQAVVSFSDASMATTDRLNDATGILGAQFTVGDSWATSAASGTDINIVKYTGATTFNPASATANTTNYDLTGGATLTTSRTVNTLRIVSNANDQVLNLGNNNLQTNNFTTAAASPTVGGLLYAGGANNNFTISSGASGTGRVIMINGNGQTQLINVYTGTLTMDAIVGNGNGSFQKSGEGTLVFNKTSGYSGATRVYQGVLRITGAGGLTAGSSVQNGAAIELGNSVAIASGATLNITGTGVSNGGALRNVATTTSSYAAAITIGTGGARINSDSGTLTLTGGVVTAGNTVTFGGAGNTTVSTAAISGSGGLVKDGAGITNLSFAHTYTGATIITEGTLRLGNTAAGGGTAGSLTATTSIINNGNLTINRSDAFTQTSDLGAGVAITGTGSFTQAGSGTTTLTAVNTYTGATNVNAGTLLINGSTSTGTVNVASGATLGGTGTVGGALNVDSGGIFAPGDNGIESLGVTGTLTLGAGSISNFEINTAGDAADLAIASALLTFGGTLNVTNVGAALEDGDIFNLFDWGTSNGTFSTVNLPALTGGLTWDQSNLYTNGTLAVVPEPSSALLGAIGMVLLLRRRR